MSSEHRFQRVAFIGNYLPRQCGIATFTTHISEAMAEGFPEVSIFNLALNDIDAGYEYPPRVRFEIIEQELASYRRAADLLNIQNVDIVCVQHEYGIYGGTAGSHLLRLLERLRMPVVTTLHTVLEEPDPHQYQVLKKVVEFSDRVIVMAQRGERYLKEIFETPKEKIRFVHHGIPDFNFADPNFYKDRFDVEGKKVLLTFGLLSPNKGIEFVIEALPTILERHPDVVYIVQGATHPQLLRQQGEAYRLRLQRLVAERSLEDHVIFHNRFVEQEELMNFINAADIYVCPYLNVRQLVSGTIAYTVGAGKAVISTPLWYSEELLADKRGVIIPCQDSRAIAEKVCYLLEDEVERHAMRKRAYLYGRQMIWSEIARRYADCFDEAIESRAAHPRPILPRQAQQPSARELPPLKLDHLWRMTDTTGLIQHAKYTVPDFHHGYSLDDNARALILMMMLERRSENVGRIATDLTSTYLSFVSYAFNEETDRFRNFMSYTRRWKEEIGSEDSHGRTLWALGTVVGRSRNNGFHGLAASLYERALPVTAQFPNLRACAFTLLGIQEFLRRYYGHRASQELRVLLAERLMKAFESTADKDWVWFENVLTYSNARIPHALLLAGQWLERGDMVDVALSSLDWLSSVQRRVGSDHFVPIGCHGFYIRGEEPARFDQQPVEASCMVSACLQAYRLTGDRRWYDDARRAFNWYLGANDLGTPVYDPATGGCFDGLMPDKLNRNQGAESTLSFLLALTEMSFSEYAVSEEQVKLADAARADKAAVHIDAAPESPQN